MTPDFYIDDIGFPGLTALRRKGRIAEGKNSGSTLSGLERRDITGTYYGYDLTISADLMTREEYDRLYEILTAPVEKHLVKIPYGQAWITFDAGVYSTEDDLLNMQNGCLWGNLTVSIRAIGPSRVPL